jgi:hypothetical protein
MRVLLDECVNERFRDYFSGHECQSARYAGFSGFNNGRLLVAAETAGFEVLITVDQGFEYQQNLAGRKIALIILCPISIALSDLLPLVPECLRLLNSIEAGQIVKIEPSSTD